MKKELKELFAIFLVCVAFSILLFIFDVSRKEYIIIGILPFMVLFIVVDIIMLIWENLRIKIFSLLKRCRSLNKIDLIKYKGYYRELLESKSSLILGYIDNFEFDKNTFIAEILYLEQKNKITIVDGRLKPNYDYTGIQNCDRTVLDNISNGKLKIDDTLLRNIAFMTQRDMCNAELITIKSKKKDLAKIELVLLCILIVTWFILKINELIQSFVLTLIVIFIFMIYNGINWYIENLNEDVYKRTKKGKELNKKLEGLKNYLKDYSMLDEREAKEIEVWEDYLIYSVMFGQNKKIIEEYEKYIEFEEKK